jgi:hypothetical protein
MKFTVPLALLLASLLTSSYALPLGNIPQALQFQPANIAAKMPPSRIDQQEDLLTRRALPARLQEHINSRKVAKAARKNAIAEKRLSQANDYKTLDAQLEKVKQDYEKGQASRWQKSKAKATHFIESWKLARKQAPVGNAASRLEKKRARQDRKEGKRPYALT